MTTTQTLNPTHSLPWRVLAAAGLLVLAAAYTQTASARPPGGPGHAEHAEHAGHRGHGMAGSPRHLERMLDEVKATPEQRAQIKQITDAARTDMAAQREAKRQLHEQNRALFAQPTVDARSAEALRAQMMAQHDQASKRMLQMRLDISRVLSPEQRAQLGERMKKRHEMMQRHRQEREALDKPRG